MKLIFVLLFIGAATCQPPPEFHETEKEFDSEFNILIDDPVEEAKEEKILEAVEAQINEENELFAEGKATFQEKLYRESDLSLEEFEREKEGVVQAKEATVDRAMGALMPTEEEINDPVNAAKVEDMYRELADRAYTPYSYNAVEKGYVTEAKNQKECGSCAAFAATGLHEVCMIKAGAKKTGLDLSEQYIIDCGYNGNTMNACDGATPSAYPKWFADNGGQAAHEADYPYLNRSPRLSCGAVKGKEWNSGAKVVDSVADYNANAEKMKQLVAEHGAVAVAIHASDRGLQNYANGVFQGCSSRAINHAVLVVGYGTEGGVPYWLVKNSWGSNWGAGGFIKIRRGTNECGIEGIAVVAKCAKSGRGDAPPEISPTPPVPAKMKCDITDLYGPGLTGTYQLKTGGPDGKAIFSEVTCENSLCKPETPGPSNACMYICGKLSCSKSSGGGGGSGGNGGGNGGNGGSTTDPGTCDVSRLYGSGLTGSYNLTTSRNGKKYRASVKCYSSICIPRGSINTTTCQYICGSSGSSCP